MRKEGLGIIGLLLVLFMLSGCHRTLPAYDDALERRVYGASLAEKEIEKLEELIDSYAMCLFSIEEGEVKEKRLLEEIAPSENGEEWEQVYRLQKTSAVLSSSELLDIEADSTTQAEVLFLCVAEYQDIRTPQDVYYFVIQASVWQEGGRWLIENTTVLGTAQVCNTDILRETFTGRIVFRPKQEGE